MFIINTGLSAAKIPCFPGRTVRLPKAKPKTTSGKMSAAVLQRQMHSHLLECERGIMRKHYVVVWVPLASGGWRAIVPGASAGLRGHAQEILPPSRDLAEITSDQQWTAANTITWSDAVVTMLPVYV
jgi:hypothetical protein